MADDVDYLRIALSGNLSRAADTFESLADRATGPEPATKIEQIEELQAAIDAGATIWEAVNRGLLNVPVIAALVGQQFGQGRREPDTLGNAKTECANLFLEVMREFLYPHGEGIFPQFSFMKETHDSEMDEKANLQARWRKHELQEQATGCRMLAELIKSGKGHQFCEDKQLHELFGKLEDALENYSAFVQAKGSTGSNYESAVYGLIYQIRCYYSGVLPGLFQKLWEELLKATAPYEEDPHRANATAMDILDWIRSKEWLRYLESMRQNTASHMPITKTGQEKVKSGPGRPLKKVTRQRADFARQCMDEGLTWTEAAEKYMKSFPDDNEHDLLGFTDALRHAYEKNHGINKRRKPS
ncbi:MAG: hypothetical protein ABSE63_09365 [Thermoguttaceae bacterium]|jgi:hypothetical protein